MRGHTLHGRAGGRLDGAWWCLLLGVTAAIAVDCASTIHFMTRVGHQDELHPVVRLAATWFGPVFGPLLGFVGKVAAYVALTIARPKWAPVLAIVCITLFLAAAAWNFHSVTGL